MTPSSFPRQDDDDEDEDEDDEEEEETTMTRGIFFLPPPPRRPLPLPLSLSRRSLPSLDPFMLESAIESNANESGENRNDVDKRAGFC